MRFLKKFFARRKPTRWFERVECIHIPIRYGTRYFVIDVRRLSFWKAEYRVSTWTEEPIGNDGSYVGSLTEAVGVFHTITEARRICREWKHYSWEIPVPAST